MKRPNNQELFLEVISKVDHRALQSDGETGRRNMLSTTKEGKSLSGELAFYTRGRASWIVDASCTEPKGCAHWWCALTTCDQVLS